MSEKGGSKEGKDDKEHNWEITDRLLRAAKILAQVMTEHEFDPSTSNDKHCNEQQKRDADNA